MSTQEKLITASGLEVTRAQAGFNHTHVTGDFYFTPLKVGDRLTPNYHLTFQHITQPHHVPTLNGLVTPAAALAALSAGADLDSAAEAGLLYTPKAEENPFLHRSPAAQYDMVLKDGFTIRPAPEESGQRMYTVECLFRPGDQVRVKLAEGATDEPQLERLVMKVAKYEAGEVSTYWQDSLRVMHDAAFSPTALELVPIEELEEPSADSASGEEKVTE